MASGEDPRVAAALAIGPSSTARERTVDITTIGRRSDTPHRIETWFYRTDGVVYLSGMPGRRGWAANLRAHPEFTFHLKHGVQADLPARATEVTDEDERRRVLAELVSELNQRHDPARIGRRAVELENWVTGSPLFAVQFKEKFAEDRAPG
jgi:nitroimidazol reductase NimA-like FMN-containing flavoprotein (pyridoxamine 5'-phosphate oxidase superfamily)